MKSLNQVLSILVIMAIASCSGSKTEIKPEKETEPKTEIKSEPEVKPIKATPVEIEITKKDTAKAEDFVFVVKNITTPKIDRGGYSVTKPEDNEKYIAIQIWIRNTSDKEISLTRDEFKLFDQNDAEYVERPGFTEHRKKPILFQKQYDPIVLKPNEAKSGWVTYTTDIESTASKINYNNITVKL